MDKNYEKLISMIDSEFESSRAKKLKQLYSDFKDRIIIAPASGRLHYHNAFEGGYLDHVLGVIKAGFLVTRNMKDLNAEIDFSKEELVFTCMNHDLGKLGDLKNPYYLPEDSDWHRKNQGKIYKHNPKINYMSVPDRSIFLLQHYGVTMTEKELVAIRLHDGLYDDGNKQYLISYSSDHKLGSMLPNVVHFADHMATLSERNKAGYV